MRQLKIERRDSRRSKAQIAAGSEPRFERHLIHEHRAGAYVQRTAAVAGAGAAGAGAAGAGLVGAPGAVIDRDFSSFIIGEGVSTASRIATIRWR